MPEVTLLLRESLLPDADDLQILRALQVAPRAGFAQIARVLGCPESLVARRYRRLRRDGIVHVTGVVDTAALGQSRWLVRIRCHARGVASIADRLAGRDDVQWIAVASDGSEITCTVLSRNRRERNNLLGEQLPRMAAVLNIQSTVMLREFRTRHDGHWAGQRVPLSEEQETALGPALHVTQLTAGETFSLSPADDALLGGLGADGRASMVELAAASGLTRGQVSRRMQTLLGSGVLHLEVDLATAALGFAAAANLWLRVEPAQVTEVGNCLRELPEVGFAVATGGRDNLHAVVYSRNLDELYTLAYGTIGALRGVAALEVSPLLRQVKQARSRVTGGLLRASSPEPA